MNIKIDLLKNVISELIINNIENPDIDINEIVQTTAISVLSDIQSVLKDDSLSDFEAIENIVLIFEKYNIPCGSRHDF
ncbi:MAG: hypothetical protein ACI4DP_01515 [Candidatus Ornithomonoglobus sp.]